MSNGTVDYKLGELTNAVVDIGKQLERMSSQLGNISERVGNLEKHVDSYTGRFVMSEGPKAQVWDSDHEWLVSVQSKLALILGTAGVVLAIVQIAGAWAIEQWLMHTFNFAMIKR